MVWFRFICVLLLGSAKANDVIDLSHQWEVTAIHGPSQVGIVESLAVDLNDDGWMDVVSASIEDGHIRAYINPQVYPNPSDLSFTERIIDDDILGVYRLIKTDINEDDLVDFIATSIDSHEIVLYKQQQSGEFIKSVVATDIILPTDVIVMDANGDGLLDVISSSFQNNTLYLHKQNASGNFSIETLVHDVVGPRKMTQADFNNDNKPDFALASSGDDSIRLFTNVDHQSWQVSILSNQVLGTRYVNHCDFNRDGWVDLVVSKTADNSLSLFTNMGDESFSEKVIDDQAMGASATLCLDLDGDSRFDLVAVHGLTSEVHTYLSSKNHSGELLADSRDGYISLDAAEFMNSNETQILTQSHFQHRNYLYSTGEVNKESVIWQDFPDGAEVVRLADINHDGINDMVLGSFRDDTVQWYDGVTLVWHVIDDQVDGVNDIFVVDLDQDGLMDVLTAASYGNAFYWHRNIGIGQFEKILIAENESFANAIAVADLDQDGQLDVIGTAGTADTLKWFKREGQTFTPFLINDQINGPSDVITYEYNTEELLIFSSQNFSNDVVEHVVDKWGVVVQTRTFGPLFGANQLCIQEGVLFASSFLASTIVKADIHEKQTTFEPLGIPGARFQEMLCHGLGKELMVSADLGLQVITPFSLGGVYLSGIVNLENSRSLDGGGQQRVFATQKNSALFSMTFNDRISRFSIEP